ncbi:MAG: hypothetical protein P8016_08190 [Sedimentisphaerales bacterium]
MKYDELKLYGSRNVNIPHKELGLLLSVSDRRHNIIYLSKAIIQAINGKKDFINKFIPKPFSPFKDVEEALKKEKPDENCVRNWLLGNLGPLY